MGDQPKVPQRMTAFAFPLDESSDSAGDIPSAGEPERSTRAKKSPGLRRSLRAGSRLPLAGVSVLLLCALFSGSVVAAPIALPRAVPSFNQAYYDGPGAWGACPLGTGGCPDQLGTTGCLVTAFASVLAYHGVELTIPAGASCSGRTQTGMNPGILNDWLRENGGFGQCSQDPAGSCCLEWQRLPSAVTLTRHSNRSDVGLNPVAAVVIDHALRQGHPVVAGVHWGAFCSGSTGQSEDCHWVVLSGKVGDTYSIVDPVNPDRTSPAGVRTTLEDGVKGSYIIDRFVVVSPTPSLGGPSGEVVPSTQPETDARSSASLGALLGAVAIVAALVALVVFVTTTAPP